MLVREPRARPVSWQEHCRSIHHRWTTPVHRFEWTFRWLAYFLSRWAFLEVLEYLGALSVLFGVVFYCAEAGDRLKQRQYQAWQVVNTAQGKGGSGGRVQALQDLNSDRVALVGVDVSGAFLQGIRLPRANLVRADLEAVDARNSVLARSDLAYANLKSANFRDSDLSGANMQHADLSDADLVGATLTEVNMAGSSLAHADLRNCDLRGIAWRDIKAIDSANIYGVRNAPAGFVDWALLHGAVSTAPGRDE
jgi:hypothetical protein